MNELANTVSKSLTGSTVAVIEMGGRFYAIKPPITKLVAKMLLPLSNIDSVNENPEDVNMSELTKKAVDQYKYIDEFIALAILGKNTFDFFSKIRLKRIIKKLSYSTDLERAVAFKEILGLINPSGFFVCARLASDLVGAMTNRKQE